MDEADNAADQNPGKRNGIVPIAHDRIAAVAHPCGRPTVPAIVAAGGERAAKRFLEFFAVTIDNPNTRAAYFRACRSFFAWSDTKNLVELHDIEPMHVAAYIRALGENFEKPPVKQHLAAIRMLFDWLVTGQVVATNRARGARPKTRCQPRQDAGAHRRRGPQTFGQHRRVDARRPARSRAHRADGLLVCPRRRRRRHEGSTKKAANATSCRRTTTLKLTSMPTCMPRGSMTRRRRPLFRSARGRTGLLTESAMHRVDVYRMILRRARDAGLDADVCCHTFRATGITAYLENGGTLENAQLMAAHESPRTTKLYDRTGDEITLDEVERIVI